MRANYYVRKEHPGTPSTLSWNTTLVSMAKTWALARCQGSSGHSSKGPGGLRSNYEGENIASASMSLSDALFSCASAVQQW